MKCPHCTDAKKALPHELRETVDAIRNFGNFSAHPIDDKTTLQVTDVESHEAE
jgi:glutaredoxin